MLVARKTCRQITGGGGMAAAIQGPGRKTQCAKEKGPAFARPSMACPLGSVAVVITVMTFVPGTPAFDQHCGGLRLVIDLGLRRRLVVGLGLRRRLIVDLGLRRRLVVPGRRFVVGAGRRLVVSGRRRVPARRARRRRWRRRFRSRRGRAGRRRRRRKSTGRWRADQPGQSLKSGFCCA
jgi:hypothetical protein